MASNHQNPTPYPDVNQVLLELHSRVIEILGDQIVGMYLYGSLATGEFNPGRSDIDFVVITTDQLPSPAIEALEAMHLVLQEGGNPWAKKLEGAYIPKAVIQKHNPAHPAVPTLNEGKFYLAPLGNDWVIQRKVLRDEQVTISGPPLHEIIDEVHEDDLKDAILTVLDEWWEPMLRNPSRLSDPGYQPYAVLSMCRVLYTLTLGELASKEKAAAWALASLPPSWSDLISQALKWVEGDEIESIDQTVAFMRHVIERCRAL